MRQFLAKASHNLGLVGRPPITARTPAITIASAQISTASTAPKSGNTTQTDRNQAQGTEDHKRSHTIKKHKSMAELDEELRLKLEGMSGEGGAAGVEYENGKAEGLKRGVKSNMFRVI
ncbi:uncharacterized protein CTRU02_202616 [Colletotrichum truncatum]|uniref:Uncharacterized protein n=1 Tax=Colletotrichum truncatum TaxID=5467 RepID=A0ACC3ZKQ9_COLTU|nr:uncharacterized protein CTRU02_01785 [Colletotrichum truncatum]KAF6800106.1 hypothetical protein CTRU02_01785 [Colletotrichum truncatum]